MSMETKDEPRREEGYERRDADVRALLKFGVGLAVTLVIVILAMRWTFSFLSKEEPLGPPPTPFENARVLPPQPRLQPHPATDLKRYCEIEQQQLTTYGWVDQNNGLVRIPVDRAMDLVLEKGLPARPANQVAPETSVTPVGSAMEPRAMGIAGPCGYLVQPASESAESKQRKD